MASRHRTFTHDQFQDLTGQTFAHLTFVTPLGNSRWVCKCSCGNTKEVLSHNVKRGFTTSCGCQRKKWLKNKTGTGPSRRLRKEYFTLKNMLRRCATDEHYLSKGIKVCDRWANSLEAFVADMGRHPGSGLTIDRIDNDKGYEPGNCRWATQGEQMRNIGVNRWVTYNGETLVLSDWAQRFNIPCGTLSNRLNRGWNVERALTAPRQSCYSRSRQS